MNIGAANFAGRCTLGWRLGWPIAALVLLVSVCANATVEVDVVHYYRFEAGPDFLVDSAGGVSLLAGDGVAPFALPAYPAGDRGLAFPRFFFQSGGLSNSGAADLSGDPEDTLQVWEGAGARRFEALFHLGTVARCAIIVSSIDGGLQ